MQSPSGMKVTDDMACTGMRCSHKSCLGSGHSGSPSQVTSALQILASAITILLSFRYRGAGPLLQLQHCIKAVPYSDPLLQSVPWPMLGGMTR